MFHFIVGFLLSTVICSIFFLVTYEKRRKRAREFSKRFAVLSEALSSLKALAFHLSVQLKKSSSQLQNKGIDNKNIEVVKAHLDGTAYILDNISTGMMPPTEEIAMGALIGHKNTLEQRAYEDSLKFRNEIRKLRHKLDDEGLEDLGKFASALRTKIMPEIKIVDKH